MSSLVASVFLAPAVLVPLDHKDHKIQVLETHTVVSIQTQKWRMLEWVSHKLLLYKNILYNENQALGHEWHKN